MTREEFLSWIYEHCEGGQVETRAISKSKSVKRDFHDLNNWPSIDKFCKQFFKSDLYFAVATRNGDGGTKDHIVEIPAIWVDVDFKDVPKEEARGRLCHFQCRPSIVVQSGGGYHVYWRLSEPLEREDIPRFERLLVDLAKCLQGDLSSAEAAHVLRIPDTLNLKPAYEKPQNVKVVWDNRKQVDYCLEDLEEAVSLRLECEPSQASTPIKKDTSLYKNENIHISHTTEATSNNKSHEVTGSHIPDIDFSIGHHDNSLFSIALHLAKSGMPEYNVLKTIEFIAATLDPKKETKRWARAKVKSAYDRLQRQQKSIAEAVREWVFEGESHIETTKLHEIPQLVTKQDFRAARQELYRLVEEGVLERVGNKRGHYRFVDAHCDDIDFLSSTGSELQVTWPLSIEDLFRLLSGNIVVVAGETDVGKTAFLLNFAQLNMHRNEIYYFSSEMGECELKERLCLFQDMRLEDWKGVRFKDRAGDFADVIRPDAINIIDFLEIHQDFYLIGKYLKLIHDKLNKGAALVAIQKNPGVEWGLGGHRGMEKARLYLTLCSNFPGGVAKIEKCKNWRNSGDNPKGKQKFFRLFSGCQFSESSEWERPKGK